MPERNEAVLEFLQGRTSHPARSLTQPAPDGPVLEAMLRAAARSPDHGGLVPWRFLVLRGAGLDRVAGIAAARMAELGRDAEGIEKVRSSFANAPLIVAVVSSMKPSPKIPEIEQVLSAGAVCLALVNAALASGFGAAWITGPLSLDRPFLTALGLGEREVFAGLVHIGTASLVPTERPRPDLAAITGWIED